MRMTTAAAFATLVVSLAPSVPWAGTLDGTVKLGGVIRDEEGDRTTVQETYNVFDGFSLAQVRLNGTLNLRDYFTVDVRDANLSSRRGDFVYRRPGLFKLTAGYDQNLQVFSADRAATSTRKDWRLGAHYTPVKWLGLSGDFGYLTRDGQRLSYPLGTTSVLGTQYDNALKAGRVSAEAHKGRIGGAVSYRISDFSDQLNAAADRRGQVVSGRLHAPSRFYDKWTHLIRGAYGVSKLSNSDIDYTLADFQYTGVVQPLKAFEFKYNFAANRIDDQATQLKTDRFQNYVDATYFHKYGRVTGGYGYELNDDDHTLTRYHSWRAGTAFRYGKYVNAKVDYAGRVKKDQEELTLLKDVEAFQVRAKLQVQPVNDVVIGGGYSKREREFPDVRVKADGEVANAFGRYTYPGWGSVAAEYSFSTDTYRDLAAGFETESNVVTGRLEFDRIRNLRLAGGVTYLDIRKDLDIEKSMVFVEGAYALLGNYHLEVKYNVYNYDDYILLDRYYTANVVRINVAYDVRMR